MASEHRHCGGTAVLSAGKRLDSDLPICIAFLGPDLKRQESQLRFCCWHRGRRVGRVVGPQLLNLPSVKLGAV